MNKSQPLLSICIPTYNRAGYLKEALDNITHDSAFDERVEIVVSDNDSTDDTSAVVMSFCNRFTNIKYYKNDVNIKDYNFFLALSRGTGRYLRLFNDTLRFANEALGSMLYKISISDESIPLFFYQNIKEIGKENIEIRGADINSFIKNVSYFSTWIANFGCWKTDIESIVSPNRFSELQLSQVDWTFQIITSKDSYSIDFNHYFNPVPSVKKGGYNIFKVFVCNYIFILEQYKLKYRTNIIERKRLLRFFVMQWMWKIYLERDVYCFDTKGKWQILFSHFYFLPALYFELLKLVIKIARHKLLGVQC